MKPGDRVILHINGHATDIQCIAERPQRWRLASTLEITWEPPTPRPPQPEP